MMADGRGKYKKVAPKFGGNKIITYLCSSNYVRGLSPDILIILGISIPNQYFAPKEPIFAPKELFL